VGKFVDPLVIRNRLGRDDWHPPSMMASIMGSQAHDAQDAWIIDQNKGDGRIILGAHIEPDGVPWLHASISRKRMPSYEDLAMLHNAVWGGAGFSYQVFAPKDQHISIHAYALHLWGRADGAAVLPNFGQYGTI